MLAALPVQWPFWGKNQLDRTKMYNLFLEPVCQRFKKRRHVATRQIATDVQVGHQNSVLASTCTCSCPMANPEAWLEIHSYPVFSASRM